MIFPVKRLADLGFDLIATKGTADVLRRNGVHASVVRKHSEGAGPDGEPTIVERILAGEVVMVVNTPSGRDATGRRLRHPRRDDQHGQADHHDRAAARRGGAGHRVADDREDPRASRCRTTPATWTCSPARAVARERGGRGRQRPRIPQVTGELVATRRVGAYQHLTFAAPGVAELARPGQFVALAVGGDTSATLLRRCFSIHKVSPSGTDGGTVDLVVAAHGPGTRWLTGLRAADEVDIVGPLGRPFPLPTEPVPCVLVGGGYGSAPLFWLAAALRERGCHVEMVLGAASEDRLFGVVEARRAADGVTVTTDDGSMGTRGWVSDVLPDVLRAHRRVVVYGCGPMAHAALHHPGGRGRGRRRPRRGRGVDGLRRGGLHDLRDAGRRRRRPDPHGPLLRRGPDLPRRPGALGRVRVGLGAGPRRRRRGTADRRH